MQDKGHRNTILAGSAGTAATLHIGASYNTDCWVETIG
jgi:hypothetical protein